MKWKLYSGALSGTYRRIKTVRLEVEFEVLNV